MLLDLIMEMKELDAKLDKVNEYRKQLLERYDFLRQVEIPNQMAEQDITSLKGEWGRCTLTSDLYVSAPDKRTLHAWLEETGNGSLIVPTVNAQTLKAFCKEQMRKGEELPDGVLKITPLSRAVIYKN